ncbi:MAG: hypothetical protein WCX82_02555 [archaeon]|jgi:hypothetical protein
MFNKKIFLIFIILLIVPKIHALQMLEPIMTDEIDNSAIELGTVAPGEYFLISFFLNEGEEYDVITTDAIGANYIFFENTQVTKESIFTIARIKENTIGDQQIRVVLKNTKTNETKDAYLKVNISNNAISTFILPFDKTIKFGVKKDIKIKVINKSITTKRITVSSNLPISWFDSKITGKLKKNEVVVLQPSGTVEVNYSFVPKSIGDKDFEIYIYTDMETQNNLLPTNTFFNKVLFERNTEYAKLYIQKDLSALYGANLYNFPTFSLNSIPVYFFNNVIRIISE